jgi:hypothetical protein
MSRLCIPLPTDLLRDTIQSFRAAEAKRLVVEVRCEKFISPKWLNFLFPMATKVNRS